MSARRLLTLCGVMFLSGCVYHAREKADEVVCDLAARPYDRQPGLPAETKSAATGTAIGSGRTAPSLRSNRGTDIQTTAFMQADNQPPRPVEVKPRLDLNIPPEVPGSETRRVELPKDEAAQKRTIRRLYPKLPPLPEEPKALPGPDGRAYTLADLQQLAAANSPQLRQAASDVQMAWGNLIQARAYPNPIFSLQQQPSNDGSTAGVWGLGVDQTIKFGGKLRLAGAAAQMDLANAELALRRARSDLSTLVRNAYFAHLVARETVRVNKALARFTDEVYRLLTGYLAGGLGAPHEPAALRALAYTARLAYKQSIQTYIYSWNQLVAAIGLRQLPLTEVAGRIDAYIPYFDYDAVRAHALANHTDVLAARNTLDKARFSLKLAQITPYPDVDFNLAVLKESSLPPKQWVHTLVVGVPLPLWDHNKGNIIAAEAALYRAKEEPHRVEEALTTTLATAYMAYKNNLDGLEYYRRFILPDQVRTYLGALRRRQIDPLAALSDLVTAQQTLTANVTSYLGILGSLWSSVVGVADLLQTDDLFQLAQPQAVPALPDLESLASWPCCHDCPPAGAAPRGKWAAGPVTSALGTVHCRPPENGETLPAPRPIIVPPPPVEQQQSAPPSRASVVPPQAKAILLKSESAPPAPEKLPAGEVVLQAMPQP